MTNPVSQPDARALCLDPYEFDFGGRGMQGTMREYHVAPSGEGELGAEWNNKPHRLLYDLLGEIQKLRAALAAPPVDARVLALARDMASYIHHSGYPRYDGGHSEPEERCQHEDCVAVRTYALSAQPVPSDDQTRPDSARDNPRPAEGRDQSTCKHEVKWTGEEPDTTCHKCGHDFMKPAEGREQTMPTPAELRKAGFVYYDTQDGVAPGWRYEGPEKALRNHIAKRRQLLLSVTPLDDRARGGIDGRLNELDQLEAALSRG